MLEMLIVWIEIVYIIKVGVYLDGIFLVLQQGMYRVVVQFVVGVVVL